MKKPIDVRAANYLKRKLDAYINLRYVPIDPEKEKENGWLSNFNEEIGSFIHRLEANVQITLFRDSILSKLIYFSFEDTEITFIRKFLKAGDIFFDVGANIGLFSLYAANKVTNAGKVFSFEPAPITYQRLMSNVVLNELVNVKSENIGLSSNEAILKFNVSLTGYDAWNSFAELNEIGETETIEVPVISLDRYIQKNNITKIDLIKIDVEGWELNVMKGAINLLSQENAPVLLVEFTETNAFAAGYYCGELFDFVKSFGYEWYSYDKETNELIPQEKKLHYPYENLIAIKNIKEVIVRLKA